MKTGKITFDFLPVYVDLMKRINPIFLNRLKLTVLVLCLLRLSLTLSAQVTPYSLSYSIKDGLPSKTVIHLYCDSKGLMWVGTDNGLCSYDGNKFRNYSNEELSSASVIRIDEDTNGYIWAATMGCDLTKLVNDSLKLINNYASANDTFFYWQKLIEMDAISDEEVLVGSVKGVLSVNSDTFYHLPTDPGLPANGQLAEINDRIFCLNNCDKHDSDKYYIRKGNSTLVFESTKSYLDSNAHAASYAYYGKSSESMVVVNGVVVQQYFKNTFYTDTLSSSATNSVKFLNDSTFVVGTENSGVLLFQKGKVVTQLFEDLKVISIELDREGGLWFGTDGSGLKYVPHTELRWLLGPDEKNEVKFMDTINAKLLTVTKEWNVFEYDQLQRALAIKDMVVSDFTPKVLDTPEGCMHIVRYGDGRVFNFKNNWSTQKDHLELLENDETGEEEIRCYSFIEIAGDTIAGRYPNMVVFDKGRVVSRNPVYKAHSLVHDTIDSLSFWAATARGLLHMRYRPEFKDLELIKEYRTDMLFNKVFFFDKHLFATSQSHGLYYVDTASNDLQNHTNWPHFTTTALRKLKDAVLIGTNQGLLKLSIVQPHSPPTLSDVTDYLGIDYTRISAIESISDTIYLGTDLGVLSFPYSLLSHSHEQTMSVMFGSVFEDKKRLDRYPHNYNFHTSSQISFNIDLIGYRARRNRHYLYRILPLDSNWTKSENQSLTFYNLPADDYHLEVKYPEGSVKTLSFSIFNYFYEETWFLVVLSIIFLAALSSPIFYQRRLTLQNERFEHQTKAIRFQSLTSQLNPHFVFNALSSIQSFILKNNVRASSEYLSKFAFHIRTALEQSRQNQVKLSNALDAIKNYLDLEQIRLTNAFEYKIIVDSKINPELINIPVMLLQPYIENAVIHGMNKSNVEGLIRLTIDLESHDTISFKIEDNGPGFNKDLSSSNKKSLGTQINQERLELLNEITGNEFTIESSNSSDLGGVQVIVKMRIDEG